MHFFSEKKHFSLQFLIRLGIRNNINRICENSLFLLFLVPVFVGKETFVALSEHHGSFPCLDLLLLP